MISVHVAEDRPTALAAAAAFVQECAEAGLDVGGCDEGDSRRLKVPLAPKTVDVVVAVGGDGTVLRAAVHALRSDAALVGINMGRVGFLAEAERDDIGRLATLLASGNYSTKRRMSLAASLGGQVSVGLNDVVIEKVNSQHMVNVDIAVDGDSFLTYRCDGVIVASPTGSSAYTLSAGGPLIDTQLEAMVITPVAPYSLFRAAVVIGAASEVVCEVVQSRPAGVNVDGLRIGVLAPGEKVVITRGPDIQMVDFSFRSYAETLKQKLRLHEGLEGVLNWESDA